MLRFHVVLLKHFCREVLQVHRDDHLCLAPDGRRKYVAVVFVRKGQVGNQILIAYYESIESRSIHQLACAFQLLPREIWPILEEV